MLHETKASDAAPFAKTLVGAMVVAGMVAAAQPALAVGKTILVFGPHEDDESLIAAGRVRAAVLAGDTAKMVLVTNGDVGGTGNGYLREGESIAAAVTLGLTEQDVIFMGYGDGSMFNIYSASTGTTVFRSGAGQTATYANRGLGGMDWHRYRTGVAGAYDRNTALADFQDIIQYFRPDEIYTVSNLDTHPDHEATALFVAEALVALKRSGVALNTKVFHSIVWPPTNGNWPDTSGVGGCAGGTPFAEPPWAGQPQISWPQAFHFVVPADMQSTTAAANLKCVTIGKYQSQLSSWLLSWARRDEFFWMNDFGLNQAITATVTVSSENAAAGQQGTKAIDGVIDGDNNYPKAQWVSANQRAGAWIQLTWPAAIRAGQVNLFDRPDANQNIQGGTLTFSDGSSILVGALPPGGTALPITFAPKTITWVRFTVSQAQGTAAGLSEFQVLGAPASSTANVPPHFISGPTASSGTVRASSTATVNVSVADVDGDPVTVAWSADAGSFSGSGTTVTYVPPVVTTNTLVALTATLLDGRGGSTSNTTFITVTPAIDGFSVNPTVVVSGGSATGSIGLAAAAPSGGLVVPLASSNPAVASVPASVTVPAGAITTTFPVAAGTVTSDTTVTLSATISGTVYQATLTVTTSAPPPPPTSGNLLASPTAIGTAPWEDWGNIVTTPNYGIAPDGTTTAGRSVVSISGGHALVQADIVVQAGTAYELTFYAKNNGGSAASYSVYDNNHGSDIVSTTSFMSQIAGGAWTKITVPFTTPSGCTSINVYLLRDSGYPVDVLLWGASLLPYVAPPVADAVTVSPSTIVAGGAGTGTITLGTAAPSGGTTVALSSSNPTAASVPASVTVAAGSQTASFAVATGGVLASTGVVITATFPSGSATASIIVSPLVVSSLTLSPATVVGGATVAGTVSLNSAAPATGAAVQFSTSDATLVGVPVSVTIPAGSTSTGFVVSTAAVTTTRTATVTVSDGLASVSATLTLTPLTVSTLTLSPTTVVGGGTVTGTVTMNGGAPGGGAAVALTSATPAVAAVPATVTVPSGAISATFPVTTSGVAASTSVVISAAFGGVSSSASLTVTPQALSTLALGTPNVVGGGTTTGTVTLGAPAPATGVVVTLTSSNTAAATVPASVTVPGGSTSATFGITAAPVTAGATSTISASAGGVTRTASLAVRALSISRTPTAVAGGGTVTGTVRLSAVVTTPTVVTLSSNTAAATVPASVTIAAGATTATFTIQTSIVTATTTATVTATFGTAVRTTTVSVRTVTASSLSLSPTSVVGGGTSTGTVTISIAAPPGGTVVSLASNRPTVATVPASVTVAAGATRATFTVNTVTVTASTASSISASTGGVTRSATLTVTP